MILGPFVPVLRRIGIIVFGVILWLSGYLLGWLTNR